MLYEILWVLYFISLINVFKFIGLNVLNISHIKLPDRGNAIAIYTGVCLTGFVIWFLGIVLKVPFNIVICWFIVGIAILLSCINTLRNSKNIRFNSINRQVLITEIIFYIFFAVAIFIRARIPNINVIEDFMNFGIMNGLAKSELLPPQDVWYSGHTMNYYYFGHYLYAFIHKLSNIPSATLYNIYFAFIVASTASISAFIGIYLSGKIKSAIFTPIILILAGNLNHVIYFISKKTFTDYYYGNSRNLVQNVITEFPAYSFVLGNLHAHLLNIPSVLVVIVLCINLYKEKLTYPLITITALFLGILGITNSWDLIIYFPLVTYIILINSTSTPITRLRYIASLTLTIFIVLIPFLLSFNSPVSGIGFVKDWIPFVSILTMFGMYLLSYIFFSINYSNSFNSRLLLILFGYALILIIIPQIIYFKDIYDTANPPFYKANTVFKFWYQAWIILTICMVPAIMDSISNLKKNILNRILNYPLFIVIFTTAAFSLWYSAIAYQYKIKNSEIQLTLMGDAYLNASDSRKPMIDWLNEFVESQPVILEAPGEAYTSDALVSSYTGLPTPVGWINHEFGWRNNWPEIASRLGDIELLYSSENPAEIIPLIDKYKIEYVVLSQSEKEKYGNHAGQGLRFISEPVVKVGDDELLKITEFTL